MLPTPLTVLLIAADVGLMGLIIAGIAYAAVAQRGSTAGPASIVGVSATILLGWLGVLFGLATRGTFAASPDRSVPAIAFGIRSARGLAWSWNVLGIADLVLAVALGFLTSPSPVQQLAFSMPNSLISRYPFVLIPTFVVPVSILLHAAALWRLRSAASASLAPGARAPAPGTPPIP